MAMWVKCRQRRPSFPSILLNRVPPSGQCRQKSSTRAVVFGQPVGMFHRPFHFVRDHDELNTRLFPSNSSAAPAAAKLKP
jgi:hypothetical protein